MIKWFGIIILAARLEFVDRAILWSTVSQSKYRFAPAFGNTGMNRRRLDMLWRHVRWRHQLDVRDEGTSHEAHWWKLVEDSVTNFNKYRTQIFSPSNVICADESISWRYGQDGHWIHLGFLMYVAINRKPDNWTEILNAECERSGIMMQIRIVKSEKSEEGQQDDEDNIPHGTKDLK